MNSSFRKTLTYYRRSGGTIVNGRWSGETKTEGEIQASVQPMNTSTLQALPEGVRKRASFRLYSNDELRTVENQRSDLVVINNVEYEITGVGPWENNVINHFKYIALKVLE